MKKNYLLVTLNKSFFLLFLVTFISIQYLSAQSFNASGLQGETIQNPTSLDFGPNNRLYVSQQDGTIWEYTVSRDGASQGNGSYSIVNSSTIEVIKLGVPNHDDDGSVNTLNTRQITGVLAAGTADSPILYVTSSDSRIGGNKTGGDTNLDTNSGLLSRLTLTENGWENVDLVRGLPRCEENHSTNGMSIFQRNGETFLLLQQGGNTNLGAPSNNFAGTIDTYLSGALLIVNLTQLEQIEASNGGPFIDNRQPGKPSSYIYDLPTLNDPTRVDIDNTSADFPYPVGHPLYNATIDLGDPFGGNNGLNQAITEAGGPVQIFSPGWRNAYDVVITETGLIFSGDNGGNNTWGGPPVIYNSDGTIKGNHPTSTYNPELGDYITNDFSEAGSATVGDALHYVGTINDPNNTYYAGHPVATRAFPALSGVKVYEFDGSNWNLTQDENFANLLVGVSGYFNTSFTIADFPNDDRQGEFLAGDETSSKVNILDVVSTSTNGMCEYTSTLFGGEFTGNLLTASFGGAINRYEVDGSGNLVEKDNAFLNGFGSQPLDVIARGDLDTFPGTIWSVTYGANNITIFEPFVLGSCPEPGDIDYVGTDDSDGDGYTNDDEIAAGTNHCSGGSQPNDNDNDFISDFNDDDDDNDGILDVDDVFAIDPNNGLTNNLPILHPFLNNDPGTGFFGLGFMGFMLNPTTATDYLTQFDPDNLAFGGAGGKATVDVVPVGDALGALNTQEYGFQFGVNVDSNSEPFTIHTELENPFNGLPPVNNQSVGFYIGNGDQDNYLKFVLSTGTSNSDTVDGFEIVIENNGVPSTQTFDVLNLLPTNGVDMYIGVNPQNNTANCYYSTDGGENLIALGLPIPLPLSFLDPTDNRGMAVGLIATTGNSGVDFTGTWDFINILESQPFVFEPIPDLIRFAGAVDESIDLNEYFEDDLGVANLTYTIESNTNSDFGLNIVDDVLNITFPLTETTTEVTIRATDNDLLFIEDTFTIQTTEASVVLFRVNSGGPQIAAIDGGLDWQEDTAIANSIYILDPGSNTINSSTIVNFDSSVNQIVTPITIFDTERFDDTAGAPNMQYAFPAADAGNYEVRLFMANGFAGTSEEGERVFDVNIEGTIYPLLNDIDLSATYGHSTGVVISHVVEVTDGTLDISFLHGAIENPLVNAIEILKVSNSNLPIYVEEIPAQTSFETQVLDGSLSIAAFGGDGNLTYSATNLPPGVQLEPTNGLITGTIESGAESGSPYVVALTISDNDQILDDDVTINFVWTVENISSLRINGGGVLVNALDGGRDWLANPQTGAHSESRFSVNTGLPFASGIPFSNRDASIPAYIDSATYAQLFAQERFDEPTGEEMEYKIPLLNGDYVVNIFVGNSYDGTTEIGDRIFDIEIEGTVVLDGFDPIASFGHQVGGMLTFPVTLTDGEMNIRFLHDVENPLFNAIEIIFADDTFSALEIDPIVDQFNNVNDVVSFTAQASGGDPQADFTYFLEEQPFGITIDPQTGEISGTIDVSAANGGPNSDGVHTVTLSVAKPQSVSVSINFEWDVANFSDAWIDKNENENYTPRHENSLVQAGDKFYLLGGRESAQTLDIYDFTTDTWENLDNSIPEEFNHFQATEYGGLIWVIGAFRTNSFPSETPADYIWSFNPVTQEWIQGPEIPANRKRGSAGLVVYNDKFYVVTGSTNGHAGGFVNWFDEYDPATETWTVLADAPRARDHSHSAVINDKLYAVGGRFSGGVGGVFGPTIAEVDVYDFATSTWSTLPADQNLPTPRGGAVTVNFNGELLVIGGEVENELVYGVNTDDALKVTESYDPATMTWTRLADMNFERHGTQGIVSGNGVFVLAGSDERGGGNQKNMECYGEDVPQGEPSVMATLTLPTGLLIANGATEELVIEPTNGNVGLLINSIEITGLNATDFSVVNGYTGAGFLKPNTARNLMIENTSTSESSQAVLTINYESGQSVEVNLGNVNNAPNVTNPGTQNSNEGDVVSLPIQATDDLTSDLTYAASGLPPVLNIDEATGLITGTISSGSGIPAYEEENGLVIIEAENLNINSNWDIESSNTGFVGAGYLLNNVNSFNTPGNGVITANISITTPGVYRFQWRNNIGIIDPMDPTTEHNDAWLRFPDADDFYGQRGTSIIFPGGSGKTPIPNGASSDGWFKVYANQTNWNWDANTSDNDPHQVFVQFDNPGVYTMEISSRSSGHLIDRVALHHVSEGYTTSQLFAATESNVTTGAGGAAENSPYTVTLDVTDDANPSLTTTEQFAWYIGNGENQPPVAFAKADVLTGEPVLTVNFTGSDSVDDTNNIASYAWDFGDGTISNLTNPTHDYTVAGTYTAILTVTDGEGLTGSDTIEINVAAPIAVTGVNVTPLTGTIEVGNTLQLNEAVAPSNATNQSVTWSSSDTSLATVDTNGLVTAVSPGEVMITVTTVDGGFTSVATLTITAAPIAVTGVNVTPLTGTIEVGNTLQLNATVAPANATNQSVTWSSSDTNLATVDMNGLVTAVSPGEVMITITTVDGGFTSVATLTITAAPIAVTGVNVTPLTGTIEVGNTLQLNAAVAPANATNQSVTWSSSDTNLATVDTNGLVTAVSPGEVMITITTVDGGFTSVATLTITAAPIAVTGVSVTPLTSTIEVGNTLQLNAAVVPANATNQSVTWSSSDTNLATVDANGLVIAVSPGEVMITITTVDGGFTSVATLTITAAPIAVTGVSVTPLTSTIEVGNTLQLNAAVAPANATNQSVTWSSSDTSLATVDANGLVTAVSPGEVMVTVTTVEGGFTSVATLTITAAPIAVTGVNVTPLTSTIEVGNTLQLNAAVVPANATNQSVTWSSSDTNLATVDANGLVTAVSPGEVMITITTVDGGFTSVATLTITAAPIAVTGVNVTPLTGTIEVGNTLQLNAAVAPTNATNQSVTWSSSDTSLATVDANGLVTAVSPGEVMVTVTTVDGGFTSVATLTITAAVTGVSVTPLTGTIEVGNTLQLNAAVAPSNATNQSVTWSSSDTSIATVDTNGLVTALSLVGQVTITVTTVEGGFTATSLINVVNSLNGAPVAVIIANPTQGVAPLPVIFNGSNSTDDNAIVSYFWDFKNGTTSTEVNPFVSFTIPGVYNVELTVTDNDGDSNTAIAVITVLEDANEAPIAFATATPESGSAPLEVQFTGSNSTDDTGIVSYLWNFDDGTTSTEVNPIKIFTTAGTYNVTLTVTDDGGLTGIDTIEILVEDIANEAPIAVVTATPESGSAPLEVQFTGSNSTDDTGIVSYLWNFDDGTTSTEVNPIKTFTTAGTYTVTLTVTDAEGLADTDSITIIVTDSNANEAPIAVVTATPESGSAPLEVQFTGSNSTDDTGIVSYLWNFDDGTTSTEVNPIKTFTTAGTYTVTLTVTDAEGLADTDSITIIVTDSNANEAPIAIVTATPESGSAPLEVQFTGSNSTDDTGIVSYLWDFDDGTTSTEVNPIKTFTTAGTYTVTLTVTDVEGLADTTTVVIEVLENNTTVFGDETIAIFAPNPARNIANLEMIQIRENAIVSKINIYDSSGRYLGSYNPEDIVSGSHYEIPVDTLRDELYIVLLEYTEGDPTSVKLLVRN